MGDPLDVQSACGDIGGDQDIENAFLELLDGSFSLVLSDIAVERNCTVAVLAKVIGDLDGTYFRFHENDHAVKILSLDDPR